MILDQLCFNFEEVSKWNSLFSLAVLLLRVHRRDDVIRSLPSQVLRVKLR